MDKKGLTIGGYESAFLADLVAAFILENSQDLFENSIYSKIYRDDGIKVDLGIQTTDEICDWLEIFQTRVNEVTGSDSLKFTMEIWNPDSPPDEKPRNERVTIVRKEAFPYLDLEMYWREDELKFRVHLIPSQVLKYLNEGSAHINACFRAIPNGVLQHLIILTSPTPENKNLILDKLYPTDTKALEDVKLPTSDVYLTLEEAISNLEADNAATESTNGTSPED